MHTLGWVIRPPGKSYPSFAPLPRVVAQTQRKMALGKLVHQLCHAILQGKDGPMLLQLSRDKMLPLKRGTVRKIWYLNSNLLTSKHVFCITPIQFHTCQHYDHRQSKNFPSVINLLTLTRVLHNNIQFQALIISQI